jgi:hypothetical protein
MDDTRKSQKVELEADAWSRFERAVDVVAKSPPQHRTKQRKTMAPKRKKAQRVKKVPT